MKKARKTLVEILIGVRSADPEFKRRGRLLARVIVISAVFNLVMTLANLRLWSKDQNGKDLIFFLLGMTGLLLLGFVWLINKRGYTRLAANLTLILYFGRICLIGDAERFSYSFWAFLLPIFIAGFVIRPRAAFPIAIISAVLYIMLGLNLGAGEPLDIIIFDVCILVVLALLSYFVASHLERAIESVNRSEARFRELFNNVPIGLYRTTADGEILDANAAFLKMFGVPSLEALQRIKAADLYASPDRRAQYLAVIDAENPPELQMRRSDGTVFWVSDHTQPIRDETDKVIYYEGSLIDITQRKKAEQKLERLAVTDPLTGIANRRQFFAEAEQIISEARRPVFKIAALMIDIDHFKAINDRYGHGAGDVVLHEVAQRIRANLRSKDTCGRYGGEEFSVLLSEISEQEIYQVADRLCKSISQEPVETAEGKVQVSVSVGIAVMDAATTPLETLLQRADQALYTAKQAGRNCWKLWSRAMNVQL